MQNHQAQRQGYGDLRKSEAQAETGLTQMLKIRTGRLRAEKRDLLGFDIILLYKMLKTGGATRKWPEFQVLTYQEKRESKSV